MSVEPIVSLNTLIERWDEFEPLPPDLHAFAFLLYSDLSQEVAEYVNKHILIIDEMTGPKFTIFVIDRFNEYVIENPQEKPKKKPSILKALLLGGGMVAGAAQAVKDGPFRIARHFLISANDVPCMVFFQHIEDDDVLVYPLDTSWDHERLTKEFKGITSDIYESIAQFDDETRQDMTKDEWNLIRKEFWLDICNRIKKRRRKAKGIKTLATIGSLLKSIREIIS
jgi:hypothetical protein